MAWCSPPSAWADLLRLQQQLSLPDLEGASALLGLQAQKPPLDVTEASLQEPFEPESPQPPEQEKEEEPSRDTNPLSVDEQAAPVYWRVESIHRKPPTPQDPPEWLGEQQEGGDLAWLMQTQARAEAAPSLVRPSALRRQLAQHLKLPQGQRRLQLRAMLPRLARLEPLRPSDWQAQRQWPGRVGLVLSLPDQMAPALADLHRAERVIKKLLGQRLQTWVSKDGPHSLAPHGLQARVSLHPAAEPLRPQRDGRPWIILGEVDLKGAGDAEEITERRTLRPGPWARWVQAKAQCGPKALLLSPWPRRELAEACIAATQPIALEEAGSLPLEQGVARLRAALYGHPGVSPNTLRHLRHALRQAGASLDAGHELGLWRDARTHAPGFTLCVVAPEHRPAVRQEFLALPSKQRLAAVGAMCHALKASQRLVRAEYVTALQAALPADAPEHDLLRQLDAEPYRTHQAMVRSLKSHGESLDLAPFLKTTELRAPEVLAPVDDARKVLWFVLHHQDYKECQIPLPGWAGPELLEWADLPPEPLKALWIGVPHQGKVDVTQTPIRGPYLAQIHDRPAHKHGASGEAIQLEFPIHQLSVAPFGRPVWADRLAWEGGEWFAWTAGDPEHLHRRRWIPTADWALEDASFDGPTIRWPGAWWRFADDFHHAVGDALLPIEAGGLFSSSARFTVRKPHWATSHGIDQYGWWATWQLDDAPPQRMRFLPPGEFWMGSPPGERGRGGSETHHPVTLTQGFWLGETTISNALWGAVMGKATKELAARPRVEVSWNEVQNHFLPALRRKTGYAGWRLPSEAQWEYAARAGTSTAYPWGDVPDRARMNIGSKVMPVDAGCPPNPWGFLHMHGNVWEWCQDVATHLDAAHGLDPIIETETAPGRMLRGGSCHGSAYFCRSAMRDGNAPYERLDDVGVRLAIGIESTGNRGKQGESQKIQPAEMPLGVFGADSRSRVVRALSSLERFLSRSDNNE